jgi:hypothetical protein
MNLQTLVEEYKFSSILDKKVLKSSSLWKIGLTKNNQPKDSIHQRIFKILGGKTKCPLRSCNNNSRWIACGPHPCLWLVDRLSPEPVPKARSLMTTCRLPYFLFIALNFGATIISVFALNGISFWKPVIYTNLTDASSQVNGQDRWWERFYDKEEGVTLLPL